MERLAKRIRTISPSLTLAISAKAKAMKAAGEDVVNFGVGEPDFNTPEHIIKAAEDALERGCTKYTPAAGLPELRRAICDKFARDNGLEYEPSQIIVSNGAKHSIFNVCFALLDPGDEVIIPAPYWLTYPEVVKVCGGVPVIVEASKKNHFKITPEELQSRHHAQDQALSSSIRPAIPRAPSIRKRKCARLPPSAKRRASSSFPTRSTKSSSTGKRSPSRWLPSPPR